MSACLRTSWGSAVSLLTRIALGTCLATISAASFAQSTFHFEFDYAGIFASPGPVTLPLAGSGTFTSPVTLSAGTYDLTSLPGFAANFTFSDGRTYSTADISTPLTGVAVQVIDLGSGVQRLFFTESGALGSNGGLHGGSIDFDNGIDFLSFAPSFFANYVYQESGAPGRYAALSTSVPEPSSWAMLLFGFGTLGVAIRRSRKSIARRAMS